MTDWPVPTKTIGGDPLGIQTVMALSYDSSPLRWLTGASIDERSYRPFCMLLHWLEFRYWGTHDVYYCWLSAFIHLTNAFLLAVLTAMLVRGPLLLRTSLGLAASAFFASSWWGSLFVNHSIVAFWPAQSDACALLFALIGLILLVSVTYAVAALRVARRGALAQQLNAIESLAAVDVVCLDKTGTLTEGEIGVIAIDPLNGADTADVDAALAALTAAEEAPNPTLAAVATTRRVDAATASTPNWTADRQVPFSSARGDASVRASQHSSYGGADDDWAGVAPHGGNGCR